MILKCTLSEKEQFAEATYYMISMIWHFWKGKTIDMLKSIGFQNIEGKGKNWVS